MKYVLTYQSVPNSGPLALEHLDAHLDYLRGFHERGVLLLIGRLLEPDTGQALGVFSTREAAEEFVAGDPFVIHGVIQTHRIQAWQEVLMAELTEAGQPAASADGGRP